MQTLLTFTLQAGLFWFGAAIIWRLNKALRAKRGALRQSLNLDDLCYLMLVSLLFTGLTLYQPLLSYIFAAGLFIYGLALWFDALLFVQFRIEVNRQTLAWCVTGSRGLSKGIPHLFSLLNKYPWGAAIPLCWAGLLFGLPSVAHALSVPISLQWLLIIPFVVVAGLKLVSWIMPLQHGFFTSASLLGKVLADDRFQGDESLVLEPEHQAFVNAVSAPQQASQDFGRCAGANIILITMESLGNYLSDDDKDGIRSRLAKRFNQRSWKSQQHFCLCPNTTVSTNQMYTGAYSNNPYNKDDSLYPGLEPKHIKQLQKQGYTTMFLDSADINLYDYHKLLSRIGFDHVWGTHDLPDNGLKADYRLWNMVDKVAEVAAKQPFFLHIINDQTHMPYEVVDKVRFNRHKGKDGKATYLNAAEEVDYILDEFLNRLGERVDLSNTLLVFTGDHGESFGEFGYSFHSNSVILPQMQVPFMLTHPNLASKQITHSCHFDLFPTFFDLLGIEYDYQCMGSSLANDERAFAYLFHSATLKGNTPANFGVLFEGDLYWVDRLFNQVNLLAEGQKAASLNQQKRTYVCSFLHRMLQQHQIMDS